MPTHYTDKGAILSMDGRYRYLLWREWRGPHDPKNWNWWGPPKDNWGEPKSCVFVMLNPSTADGEKDDPTIRACVEFAKRWRYEKLEVINLFAYRTTDPKVLLSITHEYDPVGPRNYMTFDSVLDRAGIIICAWGAHGGHLDQDETALGWLRGDECYASLEEISTGELLDILKPEEATPNNRANGGHARAAVLTSKRRKEIATKAARARWAKAPVYR